jgi:hypothetical protein
MPSLHGPPYPPIYDVTNSLAAYAVLLPKRNSRLLRIRFPNRPHIILGQRRSHASIRPRTGDANLLGMFGVLSDCDVFKVFSTIIGLHSVDVIYAIPRRGLVQKSSRNEIMNALYAPLAVLEKCELDVSNALVNSLPKR